MRVSSRRSARRAFARPTSSSRAVGTGCSARSPGSRPWSRAGTSPRCRSRITTARPRSSTGPAPTVSPQAMSRLGTSPLDDVLHYLMIQRALRSRPVTARFLQDAMKRAHEFARQAYPDWSWRPQVIGALTLVYLLGATLQHGLERRRFDP